LDENKDEAELKLKKQVSDNLNNDIYINDSHIYVSNDADVILMLTTLEDYSNVFIYSKSSYQSEIISIGKLIDLHTSKVGTSLNPGLDFTAINIMLGNDYLPKISFVDFDKLWNSYKKIIHYNPHGLIINKKKLEISHSFLILLLSAVNSITKPQFIKKLLIDNTYHPLYKNYLDGYTWCIDTYITGVCTRYNYMYNFQEAPHPLGIIYNLLKDHNLLELSNIKFNSVDPVLYGILILPKSSLNLIHNKYHKFIKHTSVLYNEECCTECKEYHEKIKILNIKKNEKIDNKTFDINKEIIKITKIMNLHKKQHDSITLTDIEDIIDKFNNYKFN
jgi:hypothetical protein